MYDDFMAGYNYGNQPIKGPIPISRQVDMMYQQAPKKIVQQSKPGVYDKSKFIRMRGPNGETGDVFANGKMYIMAGGGKVQVRTFPSRPYAIKYMQTKGWVLA